MTVRITKAGNLDINDDVIIVRAEADAGVARVGETWNTESSILRAVVEDWLCQRYGLREVRATYKAWAAVVVAEWAG